MIFVCCYPLTVPFWGLIRAISPDVVCGLSPAHQGIGALCIFSWKVRTPKSPGSSTKSMLQKAWPSNFPRLQNLKCFKKHMNQWTPWTQKLISFLRCHLLFPPPFPSPPRAPETGFGRRLKEVAFRGATGHASGLVGFRVAVPTCAVKSSRAAEVGREPERPWKCFLMVFLGWVFLVLYIYILRCQIHHIYFTIYSLYMFTCLYMPIWMSIYAFVIMNACEISICTATRLASFIFVREDSVKTGWCIIPMWTFPWLTTSPVKILHEGSLVKLLTPSAVTGLWRIGSCYASCWWSTLAKHVWPDAFDPTYNLEISPWRDKKSRYWSKATAWSNEPINRLLLSKDSPSPNPPINTQPCPNLADWSIWTASCQQGQQDAAQELPSWKSESASLLAAWSSFGHPHSAWQGVQFNKVQSSTVLSRSLTNTKITSNKNTIRCPYENNVTLFSCSLLVNLPTI